MLIVLIGLKTEMKLKNTLLAFPLQFPLFVALVFGVHNLTGLSIWWCVPISVVLDWMYYFGENIRRGGVKQILNDPNDELDRLIALIPAEGAMAMAEPIRRALEQLND